MNNFFNQKFLVFCIIILFRASSADYILSGPEKAIAFILADLGYDVWLSNIRGNTYSRHHVKLSNSDKEYWDFSFHEMAIYDVPAEIDYIYSHRKSKLLIYCFLNLLHMPSDY